jgi:hypothetical protein
MSKFSISDLCPEVAPKAQPEILKEAKREGKIIFELTFNLIKF